MNITGFFTGNIDLIDQSSDAHSPFIKASSPIISWESYSKNGIILYFSGIVYNAGELLLINPGFSLLEIISDLFQKEGYNGFKKINGKATIIIKEESQITIFRDHWGEGSLIFFNDEVFSDSMQFMVSQLKPNLKIDEIGLTSFMRYGFIPAPKTILQNVSKIPAGHVLIYKNKQINLINIFDYQEFKSGNISISVDDAVVEYERLLKQSIKRRIANYDTVGTLLSGGYDSGGNIAVLRELFDGKIKSYSIGFKDNPYSELPYAQLMADEFGAEHHEYLMDFNDIDSLPEVVRAFGEPFSESGFMLNNQAMRLVAKDNLPVIIGGDGNDQLFGTTAKELALHHLMKSSGLIVFQKLFRKLSNNSRFENDDLLFKIRFHNQKILNVMRPDNFGFNDYWFNSLFNLNDIVEHPVFAATPKKYSDFEHFHDLHNFHLDIRHSINEVILNKASRLSSYYGNHLSFSYMDNDIYDFVKKLPLSLRVKGDVWDIAKGKGVTKFIHKSYAKPKLPKDITSRKKQGGFSPLAIFFANNDNRKLIYKYIENSAFVDAFIQKEKLKVFVSIYEKMVNSQGYWFWFQQLKSNQLINLLIMALWWDIYIGGKSFISLNDFLK